MASDMSILSKNISSSNKMGTPIFHEFKKQASFFFKEKIKIARLALTDVTPTQLMTEEATDGNPWAPDSRILGSISRAAFEVDDYWRIVEILHKRFSSFDKRTWRVSYNSLIVLERLLTHGPESVAKEFQDDVEVFKDMESFQYIDEKGFNWGLAVRKKSERVTKLLEMGPLLKQERDHARKVSRGIQGFGSFCERSSKAMVLKESPLETYGRSNSHYNEHSGLENLENQFSEGDLSREVGKSKNSDGVLSISKKVDRPRSLCSVTESREVVKFECQASFKENLAPENEEEEQWEGTEESKSLLSGEEDEARKSTEEEHPFYETENQTSDSLLAARGGILVGY